MSEVNEIERISLVGTKQGIISVATISEPYGLGTNTVASIGVSLVDDEVEWKVHIPLENIDDVIDALQKAKS